MSNEQKVLPPLDEVLSTEAFPQIDVLAKQDGSKVKIKFVIDGNEKVFTVGCLKYEGKYGNTPLDGILFGIWDSDNNPVARADFNRTKPQHMELDLSYHGIIDLEHGESLDTLDTTVPMEFSTLFLINDVHKDLAFGTDRKYRLN